ncbi:MAG: hypothetical protein Q7J27_14615 [Syntrophales bacterium]|nr:hypothetical protein [Syntrophales bacterium]
MQTREAYEKLKKMAKGKYCNVHYSLSNYAHHPEDDVVACYVYIDGWNGCTSTDFKTALQKLRALMAEGKVEEEQIIEEEGKND